MRLDPATGRVAACLAVQRLLALRYAVGANTALFVGGLALAALAAVAIALWG